MKTKIFTHKQQGAVTLVTALVLLISITLVSILIAKTVLVETQMTADNYRTSQATAAASAAMDRAVAYFFAGGLDQYNNATPATLTADGLVDYTSGVGGTPPPAALTLTDGAQTTSAQFFFDNRPTDPTVNYVNRCDCTGPKSPCMATTNMTRALVTATGWSDDRTAVRTITQCVATFDLLDDNSPHMPFISKAGAGGFGNAKLINRYNNSAIWVGGDDSVHGANYGTYLRPSGTEVADSTTTQLDSACEVLPCNDASNPGPNTQLVSSLNSGNGIDVVTNDPTLASKTSDTVNLTDPAQNQFFDMFFSQTKAAIKNAADSADQLLVANASLANKTGLIWVEGDSAINGTDTVGSATKPAILIVNGDLTLNGGTIDGIIYVTGKLTIEGTPVIKGSVISENGPNTGAGTPTLVYKPWGNDGNKAPPFIDGTGSIIAGSWKDW